MKLSVIVATRNRADTLAHCLASVRTALHRTAGVAAEVVVIDNGSTDNTLQVITEASRTDPGLFVVLSEERPGKSRALNAGLRASTGSLLFFTDDDCRLHPDHLNEMLRYDNNDTSLVLRSGRIELGDPTDLPVTIDVSAERKQWSRASSSARFENVVNHIAGCNMAMRRTLFERVGMFDEDLGPGGRFGSTDDSDYAFRAYLAGAVLEHVPDMTVLHYHGRKLPADGRAVMRGYMIGSGAMYLKYLARHPNFCRQFGWDIKNAASDLLRATNTFLPDVGVSHVDKVLFALLGAARYAVGRKIPELVRDRR